MAAIYVINIPKFDNIIPVLTNQHWLPSQIEKGVKHKIATLTFRAIHGMAPEYISNLISMQKTDANTSKSRAKNI